MNNVNLLGRLTRDPEVRYTQSQMAVATFTLAVDRMARAGEEKKADFLRVTCFGKTAENCERFLLKGKRAAVSGRIQTSTYEKDGKTVYSTDIIADRVEFIDWGEKNAENERQTPSEPIPSGFAAVDDELPF